MSTVPLYYNPLINMILDKLENHDKCVFSIQDDIWRVWYPLDGYIEDISAANEVFLEHDFQLVSVPVRANGVFREDEIEAETAEHIR